MSATFLLKKINFPSFKISEEAFLVSHALRAAFVNSLLFDKC